MPHDPTGRYKGNNFDPNYAAKKKAKMEQQQPYQQRYRTDNYDQRPRDNGYNSRYERDGRGWQGPTSLDYGDVHNTPHRDPQWDNRGDRGYGSSQDYRPSNYSTPRNPVPNNNYSTPRSSGPNMTRIKTPPGPDMGATLKDLSNLVGIEPPATSTSAGANTTTGPGELSSLEKLKLFKAQVEASRAARSTDASSTAITQVAESFLQRENSTLAGEDGEVAEPKSKPTNDKAQALKAKLKALKQQKGDKGPRPSSNSNEGHPKSTSTGLDVNKNTDSRQGPSESSTQAAENGAATVQATQQSITKPGSRVMSRPVQSYADAARDYPRRRSASPGGRAASPARYPSRTKEPLERRANQFDDRYADQPPEYLGPRNRRDDVARYDRPPNSSTPRQTRAPTVSSTSINLVVKTLEVIKAQVEQLEVLIQPILDAQTGGESSQSASHSSAKEMPPPPAPSYSHQRRSSYDSYEHTAYKRRPSSYDDDDGGYHRSTPTRGGYKKSRGGAGGGRGGKTYYNNYEGREGYYKKY